MNDSSAVTYAFGDFRLYPRRRVLARADGRQVEITAKTFDALVYLVEHSGSVVTRAALSETLWPRTIVEDDNLNKLIMMLRRALGDRGAQRFIVTLQGRGYQFVADVHALNEAPSFPPAVGNVGPIAPDAASLGRAPQLSDLTGVRRARSRPAVRSALAAAGVLLLLAIGTWQLGPWRAARLGRVTRTSMVTTYVGNELGPTLSPDGKRVAFSWDGVDGNRNIYMTQIGGSGPQRLTHAREPDRDPAWSHGGSQIAFFRQRAADRFDLYVVSALGESERMLRSVQFDLHFSSPLLAWSPDDGALLFPAADPQPSGNRASTRIYALTLATGRLTALSTGQGGDDNSPAISADGRQLAFRRGPNSLIVQRLAADLTPVGEALVVPWTRSPPIHSLAWAPDGRSLVFVGGGEIFEWRVADSTFRVVDNVSQVLGGSTASREPSAMTLLRTATSTRAIVAKISKGADIFALPLDPKSHAATGRESRRFVSTAGDVHPEFSPDGRQVAFASARSGIQQIWKQASDESGKAVMLTSLDPYPAFPHWSPDGRWIAFNLVGKHEERTLYIVGADNGVPERLMGAGANPEWSADGKYLYVTELEAGWIVRVRITDGHREPLFAGAFARETPDGRQLIYSKTTEPGIFMRSLEGDSIANAEQSLVDDYRTLNGGIVPVEDGFFYVAVTPEGIPQAFRFFNYETHQVRDIAPAPVGIVHGITVSPNGNELLYAAQASETGDSDLVLLEFE